MPPADGGKSLTIILCAFNVATRPAIHSNYELFCNVSEINGDIGRKVHT